MWLNGLFVFAENTFKSSLNLAWCVFIFLVGYKLSHHSVYTELKPCPSHSCFHSNTWRKLGQRFWSELLHLTSQPTFAAAYKGLSFWITFLPLWQISVPAEHFHSINLLFLCSSPTIRYGTSFLRISNSNLVKKSALIELCQQFPHLLADRMSS